MPSLFSLRDTKMLCVIRLSPSSYTSESVMRRSWSEPDIRLQSKKLHQSCICSHSSWLCCPFHLDPKEVPSVPCSYFIWVFWTPHGVGMYVYITSPSLWPEKLTTMNFTEVYDWSPIASTGPESSPGRILAVRQTSRYTEPVHEWIGNIPVPKDKSIMWWRKCSGKTFGPVVAWRIGSVL